MALGCRYDDMGPWTGAPDPNPGAEPGTVALGVYFEEAYGGDAQGYSWRPNTGDPSRLSIHAGRAIDAWGTPKAMAAFVAECIANHEAWGIQLAILGGKDWSCSNGWTDYGGPCPHVAHAHVELTAAAGRSNTIDTYRQGGFMQEDIDQLLDAEHDTRRLFLEGFAKVLRQNERVLKAVWKSRRLVLDAISDLNDEDREREKAEVDELERQAKAAGSEAEVYEEAMKALDREHEARKQARARRDGDQ